MVTYAYTCTATSADEEGRGSHALVFVLELVEVAHGADHAHPDREQVGAQGIPSGQREDQPGLREPPPGLEMLRRRQITGKSP